MFDVRHDMDMPMLTFNTLALALALSVSAPTTECIDEDLHVCLDRFAVEVFAANDKRYATLGQDQELVGIIMERDGQLVASKMEIVDASRPWRMDFPLRGRFLALLHTHPETSQPDGFSGRSDEDVGLFRHVGHPLASYVRLASGRVRKLTATLARASSAPWIPGIPVCRDDEPCLPSLGRLRLLSWFFIAA